MLVGRRIARASYAISRRIDSVNAFIGKTVAWGILLMVLAQLIVVAMRYVFSVSVLGGVHAIWLQEGIVYLHGITLFLASAYAFLYDEHVRVDVFRASASVRYRDWTDFLGSVLFVLPLCWLVAWSALPSVQMSWMTFEGSVEPDGIPFRYILKSTILIFSGLLAIQALSIAIKAALRLSGLSDEKVFRDQSAK